MSDTIKSNLILQINTKLERLSRKYGNSYFLESLYDKIESHVHTPNVYWKTYSDGRKVLGISRSKSALATLYELPLKDILNSIPSVTEVRNQHFDDWTQEQTWEGTDMDLDDFIRYTNDLEQRIQDYLNKANYHSGDGSFWNEMPRKRDGKIVTWGTIERKLAQKEGQLNENR